MEISNFKNIKSVFFDNINIRQTFFKNTFWLAAADVINKFLKFILFIYIARILGATEYGKFSFAIAFVGIIVVLARIGLPQIITREFAKNKEQEKEFSDILSLEIVLSLAAFIFVLLGSFFITTDPVVQKIILILAVCVLSESFAKIIFAFFHARQKMEYQAFATIFETVVVTAAGIFILFYFPSVENLSYSYLFAALVTLFFLLIFLHFKVQRLSLSWDRSIWKKFLQMSWPLALVGILGSIHSQIDSVMMGYLGQITQTGWYNAAYRIVAATLIPLGLVSASFFPILSKAFGESKEKLQKFWDYYMEMIIFLAIPITIGGIAFAPRIISFVYDSSYAPSILALQILIMTVAIIFLYTPFYRILIISNQQNKFFWATLSSAAANVMLNLILIPKYSLYGAAIATVMTHTLLFLLLLRFTLKTAQVRPFNFKTLLSSLGAIISGSLMYGLLNQSFFYHVHILYLVVIGAAIYFVGIWGYKKTIEQIINL